MNHQHSSHSIGTSLFAHGLQGIDTHYRTERLLNEAIADGTIASVRPTGALRHRLGGMMIALGAAIAGKTHDLQERQATMPSPTAKSGFVPTR